MNLHDLLAHLASASITLTLNGDQLRYEAPAGAMTPAIREQIAEHRADLLTLLAAETGSESRQDGPGGQVYPTLAPMLPDSDAGHSDATRLTGIVPLWVFDRVHGIEPAVPAPSGMEPGQMAAVITQAHAAYEVEVQHWRDHPPAERARAPWRPNAPCHRCNRFDWYQDSAGKWRCGNCTPRPEGEPS